MFNIQKQIQYWIQTAEDDILTAEILMKYQLQGRYPDYNPNIPDKEKVEEYLSLTKELLLWLKKKL